MTGVGIAVGSGATVVEAGGETGSALPFVVDHPLFEFIVDDRPDAGGHRVGGVEEDLCAGPGEGAERGRVVVFDRIGPVEFGLDFHRAGARLRLIPQKVEHVVEIVGRGIVGRAVEDPGPVRGAALAGPVVPAVVRGRPRPGDQGLEADRPAQPAGADVLLQRLDGRGKRPLVPDGREPRGRFFHGGHAVGFLDGGRQGFLAEHAAALLQGQAGQGRVPVDGGGDDGQISGFSGVEILQFRVHRKVPAFQFVQKAAAFGRRVDDREQAEVLVGRRREQRSQVAFAVPADSGQDHTDFSRHGITLFRCHMERSMPARSETITPGPRSTP